MRKHDDVGNVTDMLNSKEIKTVIHNFFKRECGYVTDVGVDKLLAEESNYTVKFLMQQLKAELAYKKEYESLNETEHILFIMLLIDSSKQHDYVYSDGLVNEFKNVLYEMRLI